MTSQIQKVRIRAIAYEAEFIKSFELVDPNGSELPPFTAGAHIDVHIREGLADGLVRQYSLCNDPRERHRYVFAVLNDPNGSGGSRTLHDEFRPGDMLRISEPRNFFPLAADATSHLLIAGGIGITPMMAMISDLQTRNAEFMLHYCTRTPERTAFRDRFKDLAGDGKVVFHHDHGDPRNGLDLERTLERCEPGTHLYYCGPPGFMAAASTASAHWPKGTVHFEHFSAPVVEKGNEEADGTFQVRINSTGETIDVPEGETIVDVLRSRGIHVETSCEDGYCGTCLTRYLDGEPDHRDVVLDDEDKEDYLLICCSRSKSPLLVLDL